MLATENLGAIMKRALWQNLGAIIKRALWFIRKAIKYILWVNLFYHTLKSQPCQ